MLEEMPVIQFRRGQRIYHCDTESPCPELQQVARSVHEIKRSNLYAQLAIGAMVSIAVAVIAYLGTVRAAGDSAHKSELQQISTQLDAIKKSLEK